MEKSPSQKMVDTLYEKGQVRLPDPLNDCTTAYLDRTREQILDILIVADPPYKAEQIGFITVEKLPQGTYQIYSDREHPLIESRRHYGIAVNPNYCKRGFGKALLTLGIGVAQKDFHQHQSNQDFMIFGNEPTIDSLKMYNNAGFDHVRAGSGVEYAAYYDPYALPEIGILMKPAGKSSSDVKTWWHALWTTY